MIENYLGFPEGISGQAPTKPGLRAGAEVRRRDRDPEPRRATRLRDAPLQARDGGWPPRDGPDDRRGQRRTLSAAPDPQPRGVRGPRGLGTGPHPSKPVSAGGQHVALVGGGNSAGQAAVFLSGFAAKVSILVRDNGLETSMSRYLIDRIEATANIEVLPRTEITTLIGGPGSQLARVRWRHAITGGRNGTADLPSLPVRRRRARDGVASRVRHRAGPGGLRAHGSGEDHRPRPLPLESSIPGVFAVGDVRSGSAKRVGGAIGEGAAVVAQLHTVLADAPSPMPTFREGAR